MRRLYLVLLISIFLSSCDSQEPVNSKIPFVPVYLEIYLKSSVNKELWNDQGYKEFNGHGYKGIIVYRVNSNHYRAFEQACTFDTEKECAKVVIDDSGLFLIDKCCNSTFNFDGMVTGGPAPQRLLEYPTVLDGDYLYIINN